MAIGTYAQLKTAITDWTHRANLTSYLGDFVTLAESRIFSELKVVEMEARTSYTPTSRYLATPTRMTSIRRVIAQTTPPQEVISTSPDGIHANYSTSSGTPSYYAVLGSEIEFNKIPNINIEILYYAAPAALSDSNTTNSILTAYPDIYLSACMIEAGNFMKDNDTIMLWTQKYTDTIARMNRKSSRFHTAGPMMVVKA